MSATRKQREEFVAQLVRALPDIPVFEVTDAATRLMRRGATCLRLAEAQCNGDWPADNGARKAVPCGGADDKGCGSYWVPSVLKGADKRCPTCRNEAAVRAICASLGIQPAFQGEPRGATLRLCVNGREIVVPTS